MQGNGLILGAGILGSAIAAELSRRGVSGLHVADVDLEGSLSSTERNAGGVRHLWQQSINAELARHTIAYLEKHAVDCGFQQVGYLWLYSDANARDAEAMLRITRERGLAYDALAPGDLRSRYPFLDKLDGVATGLLGKRDGLVNANGFKNHFRDAAKARGVTFHDRLWAVDLDETSSGVTVKFARAASADAAQSILQRPEAAPPATETGKFAFVVLAGGAWTRELLRKLVPDALVNPVRRQVCVFKADDLDLAPYGMIVDTSGVYFHAEGGNILSGLVLKNEPPGYRFDYDPDFFESCIWPSLYERGSAFEKLKWVTGWGGLYSYTPDTTGLLGRVPGKKAVYEAHSFTGRGLMQSHGAALALSELILDGVFRTIDASCLSRERFTRLPKDRWLHEGLHI